MDRTLRAGGLACGLAACGGGGGEPVADLRAPDGGVSASDSGPSSGHPPDASAGDPAPASAPDAAAPTSPTSPAGDGGAPAATDAQAEPMLPSACADAPPDRPPEQLVCTGLYADVESKQLAPGVEPFTPARELWSDGADKQRFVYLPPGTQIDAALPDSWRFPVGTKLWKEFQVRGQRVETRLFWKFAEGRWAKTAYHWSRDERSATRFPGGEVTITGGRYYIPSAQECEQCHKGRDDRALGFEAVLLGLPGASGQTLATLVAAGRLANHATPERLALGDDGTGLGTDALGWLHVNCGVSCHNDDPAADGYSTDLYLRLRAGELDGRTSADLDALTTTIGVEAETPRWGGRTRIVPGSPEDSLLYALISSRNPRNFEDQMPPIASREVDPEGTALIERWIEALTAKKATP